MRNRISYAVVGLMAVAIYWFGTELSDARKQALESQERFAVAMTSSGTGTWVWEISGIYPKDEHPLNNSDTVWYSPRLVAMTGQNLGSTVGSFFEILHPDDRPIVTTNLLEHFTSKGSHPYNVEYRLKHADGSYHWYEAKGSANFNANGNPTYMAGYITEIGSAKNERTLLTKVLNMAPAAIIICDEERRVLFFNTQAEVMTGYRYIDVLNKHVEDLVVPPEYKSQHIAKYSDATRRLSLDGIQEGVKPPVTTDMIRKDGSCIKIKLHLASVQYGSKYAFVACILPIDQTSK